MELRAMLGGEQDPKCPDTRAPGQGAVAAAKAGHDAIMSPYQWVYLDYYQGPRAEEPLAIGGSNSLARTYAFDPIPASLPQTAAARILGGQTQVWSEYIPNSDAVAHMTFPRTCAMSEVFWSPREGKDLSGFLMRMEQHERRPDGGGHSVPAAGAADQLARPFGQSAR